MELLFLGTGAGLPAKSRNVSAIALQLLQERGTEWLFDCGEGTQHQILRAPVKLHRLEKVFITHLHGDHIFGLPGLLSSRSFHGAPSPLQVYGPPGLRSFVECALSISSTHLTYPVEWVEVRPGVVWSDERFEVRCELLDHVVPSYGYRVTERDKPGALRSDALKALGVPPGPIYGTLKAGGRVVLENGTVLDGREFLDPPIPGRTLAILGDTRPCASVRTLAQDADVLVHESTFHSDLAPLAHQYGHSTALDAAKMAHEAGTHALILTHISARYQDDVTHLLDEARAVHPNTYVATDFWTYAF
ncbi:ribonuclease Z [Alicyclobacillus pomorum]|jgi:ribonuclease Z|uniref:ribonuclease Z n=1 Tax=Alicyclobacillus pomorum TaxID=204470 RepID=UPI0003FA2EC2|nr:ribonuclease Z [Alicyclobacillus pomorum]